MNDSKQLKSFADQMLLKSLDATLPKHHSYLFELLENIQESASQGNYSYYSKDSIPVPVKRYLQREGFTIQGNLISW